MAAGGTAAGCEQNKQLNVLTLLRRGPVLDRCPSKEQEQTDPKSNHNQGTCGHPQTKDDNNLLVLRLRAEEDSQLLPQQILAQFL